MLFNNNWNAFFIAAFELLAEMKNMGLRGALICQSLN